MIVGIVSDSHGRCRRLAEAAELLISRGAQAIVHCGDVGSPECIEVLGACGRPAYAVAGNTDRPARLMPAARAANVAFHGEMIEIPLEKGRLLVATHGHDPMLVNELLAEQKVPYLCVGHTHQRRDERIGAIRVINPGALHRAAVHTVALLDPLADRLEFIELR